MHYSNGELHGKKTVYYGSGGIAIEAEYAHGKLHGVYREIDFPERFKYFNRERNEEYPNFAYYHPEKRIPVKKEVQYANGEIEGFYRTYDSHGNTINDYTVANGSIVNGVRDIYVRKWRANEFTRNDEGSWIDNNGNTIDEAKTFDIRFLVEGNTIDQFMTAEENSITNGLRRLADESRDISTIREFYKDGEIIEQTSYSSGSFEDMGHSRLRSLYYENGEIDDFYEYVTHYTKEGYKSYYTTRKKRINGEMIEIFNYEKGINRLKEFDLDN
jgi:antitoxin component YwqK of YwqJK toxin-antitoxin module